MIHELQQRMLRNATDVICELCELEFGHAKTGDQGANPLVGLRAQYEDEIVRSVITM